LLGEAMVTPYIRRRGDSENVNRYTRRATMPMGVPCKQPASVMDMKKDGGRRNGWCSICPTAKDRRTNWKCYQCSEWV